MTIIDEQTLQWIVFLFDEQRLLVYTCKHKVLMKIIYFTSRSIKDFTCMQWNISFWQVAWKRDEHMIRTIWSTTCNDQTHKWKTHDKTHKWITHDQITSRKFKIEKHFMMTPILSRATKIYDLSYFMHACVILNSKFIHLPVVDKSKNWIIDL